MDGKVEMKLRGSDIKRPSDNSIPLGNAGKSQLMTYAYYASLFEDTIIGE